MSPSQASDDETFDPRSPEEWAAFRALAHRMVDDMCEYLETVRERPAWREMPASVRTALAEPVPHAGIGAEAAYEQFRANVLPYPTGNIHPRFFGWVKGTGTPLAMMAEMLAAGMNAHMAGFNQAPALVEQQVIDWLAESLGMPRASGVFVTGGTMANTLGLAVARYAAATRAGVDVREDGVQSWPGSSERRSFVFYGSEETHGWARKAAEFLGLGNRSFRRVPVDGFYRIDLRALSELIAADRAKALIPFCVIGTAGTVNTGAIDDLAGLADLCRRERLWFHVDAAFGALAYLSDELRPRVAGMAEADSVGFDLHKWGSMPFECACLLVRDPEVHRAAFAAPASYLAGMTRGVIAGGLPFADRGVDLTRGFKALKVWMSLKADGLDKLARVIEKNVLQAERLGRRIAQQPDLELLAPVSLNVVCFRYAPRAVDDVHLDSLNQEILLRMQERGIAVPSSTVLQGRFALRVANVNQRARQDDLDAVLEGALLLGDEIVRERERLRGSTVDASSTASSAA